MTGSLRRVAAAAGGRLAIAVCVLLFVLMIVAPPIWGEQAATTNPADMLQGSSSGHWLGTDNLGRDIFARVMVATRESVGFGLVAALSGAALGVLFGAAVSMAPPRVGRLASAVIGIALTIPTLLVAMLLSIIVGVGTTGLLIALILGFVPGFARLTQTLVASVISADFVSAARIAGVGRARLLRRHILLNSGEPLIIQVSMATASAIAALAGFSFLGLGTQPPSYDWGQLLNTSFGRIYTHPETVFGPAVAVVVAGLGFNLLGEAIAQVASGRTTRSRKQLKAAAAQSVGEVTPETGYQLDDGCVLSVRNLRVVYPSVAGPRVEAVRHLDLDLARGERLGIVGESGSGKTQAALALADLISPPGVVQASRLDFDGLNLLTATREEADSRLGTKLALVFQNPMSSFNPVLRMGRQLTEGVRKHVGLSRRDARARAVERLTHVQLPDAAKRINEYPHEYSGGMRQRAMVAMGLMGSPALIIADEPTTALDVTVQRGLLDLLRSVNDETGAAIVLISHDLAVVSNLCERVIVMYAGRVVEDLPVDGLVSAAAHPYTRALVGSIPDMHTSRDAPLRSIGGRPFDATADDVGCAFAARCPRADQRCHDERPVLSPIRDGHQAACWHPQAAGPVAAAVDEHEVSR